MLIAAAEHTVKSHTVLSWKNNKCPTHSWVYSGPYNSTDRDIKEDDRQGFTFEKLVHSRHNDDNDGQQLAECEKDL